MRFILLATALVLTALTGGKAAAQAEELTPSEQRRLDAGELVRRNLTREDGDASYFGGLSWQVIDASPDAVWNALSHTEDFPSMFPRLAAAQEVAHRGNEKIIHMEHRFGMIDAGYYVRAKFARERGQISFRLEPGRPGSLKAAWGFFIVKPRPDGRTLLAYACMVDVGAGVLNAVFRPTVHDWMLRVPTTIKQFIEREQSVRVAAR